METVDDVELDRQTAFGQDFCAALLAAYYKWMANNDGKDIWCEAVIKGVMWAAAYVVGETIQDLARHVMPMSREDMLRYCMELFATGLDKHDALGEDDA